MAKRESQGQRVNLSFRQILICKIANVDSNYVSVYFVSGKQRRLTSPDSSKRSDNGSLFPIPIFSVSHSLFFVSHFFPAAESYHIILKPCLKVGEAGINGRHH